MEASIGPTPLMHSAPSSEIVGAGRVVSRDADGCAIPARSQWLISPWIDLTLFANVWWLLAFVPLVIDTSNWPRVEFWQVYFLSTPHRWLTLVLVLLDPSRRRGRESQMKWTAIGLLALVGGWYLVWGQLICLLAADYIWNAWHFGAQHAGILSLYRRRAGGHSSRFETWGIRCLVTYTALRIATWLTGFAECYLWACNALRAIDEVALVVVALLLARQLLSARRLGAGGAIYASSVCLLYAGLLLSARFYLSTLAISLAIAASAMHAVEYLAFVSHYIAARRVDGATWLLRRAAVMWGELLATFLVVFGLAAATASEYLIQVWLGINLWVALMHYTLDGMIWKLREPATASALGASSTVNG